MEKRITLACLNDKLMHEQKDIINALEKYDQLNENERKLVLLSAMFSLNLTFDINGLNELVTREQLISLMYIKFVKKLKNNFKVQFCDTVNGASIRILETNTSFPINQTIYFKEVDSIDVKRLLVFIHAACNEWSRSDDFLYAPDDRYYLYKLTRDVVFNELCIDGRYKRNKMM